MSGAVYQTPAELVAALRVATASSYTIVAGSDAWQHMGKLTSLGEQAADMIVRMSAGESGNVPWNPNTCPKCGHTVAITGSKRVCSQAACSHTFMCEP